MASDFTYRLGYTSSLGYAIPYSGRTSSSTSCMCVHKLELWKIVQGYSDRSLLLSGIRACHCGELATCSHGAERVNQLNQLNQLPSAGSSSNSSLAFGPELPSRRRISCNRSVLLVFLQRLPGCPLLFQEFHITSFTIVRMLVERVLVSPAVGNPPSIKPKAGVYTTAIQVKANAAAGFPGTLQAPVGITNPQHPMKP